MVTLCKDRAWYAVLSHWWTNRMSPSLAVPLEHSHQCRANSLLGTRCRNVLKVAVGQFSGRVSMSNVHAALPTEVNRVKTRIYVSPIRGPSRWPRGQRVANGASVGNSLAQGPTGPVLWLVHRGFTGLNEWNVALHIVLRLPDLSYFCDEGWPRMEYDTSRKWTAACQLGPRV